MRANTPALKRPDITPAETMSQVAVFERCTTKRRNRLNGIADRPHVHEERRWKLRTHIESAAVAGYLVLIINSEEGLETLGHFSDMWWGKEEP
jgi:hypothetical protein